MARSLRFFTAALLAAAVAARAMADPDAVIARARAYLGSEAALKAINSIHYVGTLAGEENVGSQAGKEIMRPLGSIDIVFQKPYRQRITIVSSKGTDITGLDGYEAWRRLEDAADSKRWRLILLDKGQINSLRANVWENLSFFWDIERRGGHVEDLGPANIDGHACEELVFVHEPAIKFYRYFDQATGRLILTRLENGDRFREKGEMMVNGVRFPQTIVYLMKDRATGKVVTRIITLNKIMLNEVFPDSLFTVPMFSVE